MLHQKPGSFALEPQPREFNAAHYVAEMRAVGVKFTVSNCVGESVDDYVVGRDLDAADIGAVNAIANKWAPTISSDEMDEFVGSYLDEEAMYAWALGVVGNDLALGLEELRKIRGRSRCIYAAEKEAADADLEGLLDETKAAHLAADKVGHQFYFMLRHLWERVPIVTFEDAGLKACLAAEHGDYIDDQDPDENIRCGVIKQIAAFYEQRQARKWIVGARKAGLSVFPWHGSVSNTKDRGVMIFGQDMDGPNDYGAASNRFRKKSASRAVDGLREGIVFDALCRDFSVDPDDPEMCTKVNAKLAAAAA